MLKTLKVTLWNEKIIMPRKIIFKITSKVNGYRPENVIVPFGVRNSTLIIVGACVFFFENPLPVFAANDGIGTNSPPAVN